jgi:hypothetical protein
MMAVLLGTLFAVGAITSIAFAVLWKKRGHVLTADAHAGAVSNHVVSPPNANSISSDSNFARSSNYLQLDHAEKSHVVDRGMLHGTLGIANASCYAVLDGSTTVCADVGANTVIYAVPYEPAAPGSRHDVADAPVKSNVPLTPNPVYLAYKRPRLVQGSSDDLTPTPVYAQPLLHAYGTGRMTAAKAGHYSGYALPRNAVLVEGHYSGYEVTGSKV